MTQISDGPAAGRVNPLALARLVQDADASDSSALVMLHAGDLAGSWLAGCEVRRIEAMSATKSVLNLAVGRLLALGLLDPRPGP